MSDEDKVLLELAAKAANIITPGWYGNQNYLDGVLERWNPLTDDGDALRLAVRLEIDFYQADDDGATAYVGYFAETGARQKLMAEQHGSDPYAATRRAIVRAAAEIGRRMP